MASATHPEVIIPDDMLLTHLGVLASLSEGVRLHVTGDDEETTLKITADLGGIGSSIKRWWKEQSRERTAAAVEVIARQGVARVDTLSRFVPASDTEDAKMAFSQARYRMKEALKGAERGIRNLATFYQKNPVESSNAHIDLDRAADLIGDTLTRIEFMHTVRVAERGDRSQHTVRVAEREGDSAPHTVRVAERGSDRAPAPPTPCPEWQSKKTSHK